MKEIALVFFRLGSLGFGGPLATMAMMEEECSRKRSWITTQEFAEIYALCKIFPGPVATQMAIYLGKKRAGLAGGIIAGTTFILPSFFIVLTLSFLYVKSGALQSSSSFVPGMQIAALAVISLSLYQLAKPFIKIHYAWVIAGICAWIMQFAPEKEPILIIFWGALGAWIETRPKNDKTSGNSFKAKAVLFLVFLFPLYFSLNELTAWAQVSTQTQISFLGTLLQLFLTCFKASAFVFGTGLAIVPYLEADVVQRFQWLNQKEFLDGLTLGQVTPGPVIITVTFIGFLTAGILGAFVATFATFLPSFINILVLLPKVWNRLQGSNGAKGFLKLAMPAVIGCIAGTLLRLFEVSMPLASASPVLYFVFVAVLFLGYRFKIPAWLTIPSSGLLVWISQAFLSI